MKRKAIQLEDDANKYNNKNNKTLKRKGLLVKQKNPPKGSYEYHLPLELWLLILKRFRTISELSIFKLVCKTWRICLIPYLNYTITADFSKKKASQIMLAIKKAVFDTSRLICIKGKGSYYSVSDVYRMSNFLRKLKKNKEITNINKKDHKIKFMDNTSANTLSIELSSPKIEVGQVLLFPEFVTQWTHKLVINFHTDCTLMFTTEDSRELYFETLVLQNPININDIVFYNQKHGNTEAIINVDHLKIISKDNQEFFCMDFLFSSFKNTKKFTIKNSDVDIQELKSWINEQPIETMVITDCCLRSSYYYFPEVDNPGNILSLKIESLENYLKPNLKLACFINCRISGSRMELAWVNFIDKIKAKILVSYDIYEIMKSRRANLNFNELKCYVIIPLYRKSSSSSYYNKRVSKKQKFEDTHYYGIVNASCLNDVKKLSFISEYLSEESLLDIKKFILFYCCSINRCINAVESI